MKTAFTSADILLPKKLTSAWSVIACDQYTSDVEYWKAAEKQRCGEYSTLDLILPEVYLDDDKATRIEKINAKMREYLNGGVFDEYKDAMIFVDRTLPDGKHRYGVVGAVDLEKYDYTNTQHSQVRATEQTVLDRIPPRVEIRKDAELELPHVLLLIDDAKRTVIEPLKSQKLELLYDYELMLGGGHIKGYLIDKPTQEKVISALEALGDRAEDGLLFASGDGNHSLATAKECYARSHNEKLRYALVELCNVHDDALEFEPIYRVLFNAEKPDVISEMDKFFGNGNSGNTEKIELADRNGKTSYIIKNPQSNLAVGSVEKFIQSYLKTHKTAKVDYIHGLSEVERLCKNPMTVGFVFDGMRKEQLFETVIKDGVLPRKTFSMGEANSKRFYTECRKLK